MRFSTPRSFRGKLLLLVAVVTSMCVGIQAVIMRSIEFAELRPSALKEASVDADVIAANSVGALAFDDRDAVRKTLESLRSQAYVLGAGILDASGAVFSTYDRSGSADQSWLQVTEGHRFDQHRLTLATPVVLDGERLGTLVLHCDLSGHYDDLRNRIVLAMLIGSIAVGTALTVAMRLLRGLVRPIRELTNTSSRISQTEDYSLRVRRFADDELGRLTDSFNAMIAQIQSRDERLVSIQRKLTDSNEQLEQFAYIASHDLQEPLRKIQAFGNMLRAEFTTALGEEGHDYLERMYQACTRMRTLIEDLLSFSRVTTKSQQMVPVDLASMASVVLEDLDMRVRDTGGRVEIGDLPVVNGDLTQLRQLFQNLIGNALKFHRDGVPPVVRVNGRPLHEFASDGRRMCRITVADNGIGFDEKYLDRIFRPFQRLHGRNSFEGTGIGLAVCRKVVERHGGALTAESTPGAGSIFVITIPMQEPATHIAERVAEQPSGVETHAA